MRWSETGQGTLDDVLDGSRDPWRGPGLVGRPTGRSGTGWGTNGEVRYGLGTFGEVRDGLGNTRGGLGRVGGPSERSGMGR